VSLPESYEERRKFLRENLNEEELRYLKREILLTSKREGISVEEAKKKVIMSLSSLAELKNGAEVHKSLSEMKPLDERLKEWEEQIPLLKQLPYREFYESLSKGKPLFLSILKYEGDKVSISKNWSGFIVSCSTKRLENLFLKFIAPYSCETVTVNGLLCGTETPDEGPSP